MSSLSQFLSDLYSITMAFFTLLLLELVILVRSVAVGLRASSEPPITAARLLELVEEKSPATRYTTNNNEPIDCVVCLFKLEEGEEIRNLKCNHMFHKVCLDTWLQQNWATCPLCRTMVLPEEVVVRFRQRRWHHHQEEDDGSDEEELFFLLSALHGSNLHRVL